MDKEDKQPIQRVRFGDQRTDEEAGTQHVEYGGRRARRLSRQSSVGSLSIHSAGGANRTVQPETALPITYRTLSIEIGEGQQQKQKEAKKVKEKAVVGKSVLPLMALMSSISDYTPHMGS
jgi:sodium/potassium-transporting ATPase subunit alpha